MLLLLLRRPWAAAWKTQIGRLSAQAESCSRQLRAWAESLQNSEIAGTRHLNNQSRANYEKHKTRTESAKNYTDAMEQAIPPGHLP